MRHTDVIADSIPCPECTRVSDTTHGPGCAECRGTGRGPGIEMQCRRCGVNDVLPVHEAMALRWYRCPACERELDAEHEAEERRQCAAEDAWDARRDEERDERRGEA